MDEDSYNSMQHPLMIEAIVDGYIHLMPHNDPIYIEPETPRIWYKIDDGDYNELFRENNDNDDVEDILIGHGNLEDDNPFNDYHHYVIPIKQGETIYLFSPNLDRMVLVFFSTKKNEERWDEDIEVEVYNEQQIDDDIDDMTANELLAQIQALNTRIQTLENNISGKQNTISDLNTIRSGAALGATAIQQHQDLSNYATINYVDNKSVSPDIDKNYIDKRDEAIYNYINNIQNKINNNTDYNKQYYERKPLTFEILEDGEITWNNYSKSRYGSNDQGRPIYYSINNSEYIKIYPNLIKTNIYKNSIQVHTGDKVYIKSGTLSFCNVKYDENGNLIYTSTSGENVGIIDEYIIYSTSISYGYLDENNEFHYFYEDHSPSEEYYYFSTTCKFNLSGNLLSFLVGDYYLNFYREIENNIGPLGQQANIISGTITFGGIFKNCINLISAKNLILPNKYVSPGAFKGLFYNCSSLIEGPIIPDITQPVYGYPGGGTNLKENETSWADSSENIFINCSSLHKIIFLMKITRTHQEHGFYTLINFFEGLPETGTLYIDPSVDPDVFKDIIPLGWSIQFYIKNLNDIDNLENYQGEDPIITFPYISNGIEEITSFYFYSNYIIGVKPDNYTPEYRLVNINEPFYINDTQINYIKAFKYPLDIYNGGDIMLNIKCKNRPVITGTVSSGQSGIKINTLNFINNNYQYHISINKYDDNLTNIIYNNYPTAVPQLTTIDINCNNKIYYIAFCLY